MLEPKVGNWALLCEAANREDVPCMRWIFYLVAVPVLQCRLRKAIRQIARRDANQTLLQIVQVGSAESHCIQSCAPARCLRPMNILLGYSEAKHPLSIRSLNLGTKDRLLGQ